MALVRFNPALEALRGKVGDWVYRHCQRKARAEGKSEISVAFQACYYHQPLKDLPGGRQ